MKMNRFVSLMLACILLLLPLSGCGKKNTALDGLESTDELVIYLPQEMEWWLMDGDILPYRALYPDVQIRIVVVPGNDYSYADYAERVTNDLLAGDGPDVLYLEYLPNLDIQKAALNHNFYDLTDLLASDPDFHEEDFVDGVLDAVKLRGRQYTMPRSFFAPNYLSDGDRLEALGFDWDGIGKTSDFMEELVRLTPAAAQDEAFRQMLESRNCFFELFRSSGIRLLDYEEEQVLPDEEEFRAFMESCRAFFPFDYDPSGQTASGNARAEELCRGDFLFWYIHDFDDLNRNMVSMAEAGRSCTIGTLPAQTGEIVGQISAQFAISAASKNVRNAYRYIQMLCSEEILTGTFWLNHERMQAVSLRNPLDEVPVRRRAVEAVVRGEHPLPGDFFLSDEEEDGIIRQFSEIDRFTVRPNDALFDMMWEAMLPYLKDGESYEDCVTELKRKLTFYLSE